MKLPIDRYLNFAWQWCLERIDPERREEWIMQMEMPLPWSLHQEPTEAQLEREFEGWSGLLSAGGK